MFFSLILKPVSINERIDWIEVLIFLFWYDPLRSHSYSSSINSSAKDISDFFSLAIPMNRSEMLFCFSPITTAVPSLIIPAFSLAISSIVFPKNWVWSIEILVITETSGKIIFVESSLPPIPTSITAISIEFLLKYSNANPTVISKKEKLFSIKKSIFSLIKSVINSFLIITPLIFILSLKSTKWGEVYSPTLYSASCKIEDIICAVDPLPLVPAIWIDLKPLCGLFRWLDNFIMLFKSFL